MSRLDSGLQCTVVLVVTIKSDEILANLRVDPKARHGRDRGAKRQGRQFSGACEREHQDEKTDWQDC